jgi:hypothetical protein
MARCAAQCKIQRVTVHWLQYLVGIAICKINIGLSRRRPTILQHDGSAAAEGRLPANH